MEKKTLLHLIEHQNLSIDALRQEVKALNETVEYLRLHHSRTELESGGAKLGHPTVWRRS